MLIALAAWFHAIDRSYFLNDPPRLTAWTFLENHAPIPRPTDGRGPTETPLADRRDVI